MSFSTACAILAAFQAFNILKICFAPRVQFRIYAKLRDSVRWARLFRLRGASAEVGEIGEERLHCQPPQHGQCSAITITGRQRRLYEVFGAVNQQAQMRSTGPHSVIFGLDAPL